MPRLNPSKPVALLPQHVASMEVARRLARVSGFYTAKRLLEVQLFDPSLVDIIPNRDMIERGLCEPHHVYPPRGESVFFGALLTKKGIQFISQFQTHP